MEWRDTAFEVIKWVLGILITGGGLGTGWAIWRERNKDNRTAPQDTAETLRKLLAEAANAHVVAAEALKKAGEAEVSATLANRRAHQAEETVYVFRHVIIKHVVSVVDWIDDGAPPPPPTIHHELRRIIEELTMMEKGDGPATREHCEGHLRPCDRCWRQTHLAGW